MRQVLFRIPLDGPWCFGPLCLPGFGWGLVLGLWVLAGGFWAYRSRKEISPNVANAAKFAGPFAVWCVLAVVIVFLPNLVHRSTDAILEETAAVLKDADRNGERFAEAYAARDRAWRSRRMFDEAMAAYEIEIKQHPDFAPANIRLAWILATAPVDGIRDGERAVAVAQQAVTAARLHDRPQLPAAFDVLAAALAETGKFDDAVKFAKQAAEKSPPTSVDDNDPGQLIAVRQRMNGYLAKQPHRDRSVGKSLPVYGYGFMLFLGFAAGGWTAMRRGQLVGVEPEAIWDVCLWVLVGGIGGARLFYIIQYSADVFKDCESNADYFFALVNLQQGGLVLYGGMMMGLTAFIVFCYRRKLSPLLMTDVIMPSFFIGLAFGRLGCFMNGCCYGDRCELPWAISFPLGSVPDMALVGRGFLETGDALTIALHPSQLYSAFNALALAALTHCYFLVRHRDGAVLGLALLTYPITRFLIEFLRGDEMGKLNTPLTISQIVSLGMLAGGVAYVFWLSRRPKTLTPFSGERSGISPP